MDTLGLHATPAWPVDTVGFNGPPEWPVDTVGVGPPECIGVFKWFYSAVLQHCYLSFGFHSHANVDDMQKVTLKHFFNCFRSH